MPSTKITIEQAKEILKEFDKAYRLFYRNSYEHIKLSDRRSGNKQNAYFKQASADVKEFVNKIGFSSSWIWSFLTEKQLKKAEDKRRYFSDGYIELFEKLIIFYLDHIFVKRHKDGRTEYIKKENLENIRTKKDLNEVKTANGDNRIYSFFNVKKEKPFFTKYSTILILILTIITSLFNSYIAIFLIVLQILSTKHYVSDTKVKKLRNSIHYLLLLFILTLIWFRFHKISNETNQLIGIFDPNPIPSIRGTMAIYDLSKENGEPFKYFNASDLNNRDTIKILLQHSFKNIGYGVPINQPFASLNIINHNDYILFRGVLSSYENQLIDSVYVNNLKDSYQIQFLEGYVTNPLKNECKGYGYNQLLDECFYIENFKSVSSEEMLNGICLNPLDINKGGNCSSGSIFSVFNIIKQ